MNFIDAVIAISKRSDLEICNDEGEMVGLHPSICVYKDDVFLGKLRWPWGGKEDRQAASVDEELILDLNNNEKK